MVGLLRHNWWLIALRGLAALVLAVLILAQPSLTLRALIFLFGVYTLVDGFLSLVAAFRREKQTRRRWSLVAEGLMGIFAGIVTLLVPDISAQFILVLLSIWAITTGVSEVRSAVQLRREIAGEWLLGLGGVTSVLFGLLLLLSGGSTVVVVVLLSGYAFVFGLLLLALAVRLKWAGGGSTPAVDGTP